MLASRMRFLWLSFILLLITPAEASPWRVEPAKLSSPVIEELRQRFPTIEHPDQLAEILSILNRSESFLSVEADLNDGTVVIRALPALVIGEIDLQLSTRMFTQDLEALTPKFVGSVDSPEAQLKLRQELSDYLAGRGFFQSQIQINRQITKNKVSYRIRIDEGYPCIFREIMTGFSLPTGQHLDVNAGAFCDRRTVEVATRKLDEDLRQAGFNQRKILSPEIRYDSLTNSATLFLPGQIGKKVRYRIDASIRQLFDSDLRDLDPSIIDPDLMASEITRKYRGRGYDDVIVQPPRIDLPRADEVIYIFEVDVGPRYAIDEIEFQGLTVFTREEALKSLDFQSLLRLESPALNEEAIRQGIDSLKSRYAAEGYWDAKIALPRITKDRQRALAKLVFLINEGQRRLLTKISIQGENPLSPEELKAELEELQVNKPLIFSELTNLDKRLKTAMQRLGYVHATARINLKERANLKQIESEVDIQLQPGERAKFGTITVLGLSQTQERVVRRELLFRPGDWYDPEKVDGTREALLNLGLFRSVTVVPSDDNAFSDDRQIIPFTVTLREGKPGAVSFGPGWSLVDGGRFAVEASYNNIHGLNRQVFIRAGLNEEANQDAIGPRTLLGHTSSLGYVEPYIFEWPINAAVTVLNRAKSGPKRWDLSKAGEFALTHKLRHILPGAKIAGFYGQKVNREEAGFPQRDNLVATGNVRIGRIGTRFEYDRRNDLRWPTRGYTVELETSWARYALGGNLRYFFWELINNYYFELAPRWVVAAGYGFSAYEQVERRDSPYHVLPASERLLAGGADTNRGFRAGELGPEIDYFDADQGARIHTATGASHRSIYKLELRYQLVKDSLAITAFTDASTVFFSRREIEGFKQNFADNNEDDGNTDGEGGSFIYDNEPYAFGDVLKNPMLIWNNNYRSYGVAMNLLTALGSVNFSYGIPVKSCPTKNNQCVRPRPDGKGGAFHINVGASF